MLRLLSKKEPTKISEVRVEKKFNLKVEEKPNPKSFVPPKPKSEDEMSAWEYYSFIMRFGKRKMNRHEWLTWWLKKNDEDRQKRYVRRKEGPLEGKISPSEFNWRMKKDSYFDERMYEMDFNPK